MPLGESRHSESEYRPAMHLLVNALSVTNASGRHVLLGHLTHLAEWTRGRHRMTVLHHAANADLVRDLGSNVAWHRCPDATANWWKRTIWERFRLPPLASRLGADALFNPSGLTTSSLRIPQFVLCQNPWCLVDLPYLGIADSLKAWLQRRAYARAVREAALMAFNSRFMRDAYVRNAGREPRLWTIAYQGPSDETTAAAAALPPRPDPPAEPSILCVSAMSPLKGAHTLIDALALLHDRHGIAARLRLIGGWSDADYRRRIERLIDERGMRDFVTIEGHVPLADLHRAYAESRVYCLLSICESFGIPAVEAQAFGTPVVTSDCCAMPEVGGNGGRYPRTGDASAAAEALAAILRDDDLWRDLSAKGLANVRRFHWDECSRPLLRMFDDEALRASRGASRDSPESR